MDRIFPLILRLELLRAARRYSEVASALVIHFLSAFVSRDIVELQDKFAGLIRFDIGNRQIGGDGDSVLLESLVRDVEAFGGFSHSRIQAQIIL